MDLDSRTEEQIQLLVDSRNRTILTVLDNADGPLGTGELADRLVSRDESVISSSKYFDRRRQTLVSLHHDSLPRLADAGLIEFDPDENLVTYRRDTGPNVEWEGDTAVDTLIEQLPSNPAVDREGSG